MKFKKDVKERMIKTFIQTLLGYIAVNIFIVDFNNEKEAVRNSIIALIIAGVSTALCAMMNTEDKNIEIPNTIGDEEDDV